MLLLLKLCNAEQQLLSAAKNKNTAKLKVKFKPLQEDLKRIGGVVDILHLGTRRYERKTSVNGQKNSQKCPISCIERPLRMTSVDVCLSVCLRDWWRCSVFFFSAFSVDAAADGGPASHKSHRCISHHRNRIGIQDLCNYSYRVNSQNPRRGK